MISVDLAKSEHSKLDLKRLMNEPTLLFDNGTHQVYWLGIPSDSAFHCNSYLIVDNNEGIIVDPGSNQMFEFIKKRVEDIIPIANITAITASHQDPDVCSSLYKWIEVNEKIKVISTARANVLLSFYAYGDYDFFDTAENIEYSFSSGNVLKFVPAPFMHFPGAFTIYDTTSNYLFSGDIWAALDVDWKLVVDDFESHTMNLDLFHMDYIASGIAAKGFVRNLDGLEIDAILPQHGSIISKENVLDAIDYLENLVCGLDMIYPDIF